MLLFTKAQGDEHPYGRVLFFEGFIDDITERVQPSLGGSSLPHFLTLRINTSETLQLSLCAEAKSRPGECY